jgi:hypothetical protein
MLDTAPRDPFLAEDDANWLWQEIIRRPISRPRNARVMVVSPNDDPQRFCRTRMGQVLVWGLKRGGIEWVLRNPAHWRFDPDRYDAVLCWPYGFRNSPGFLRNCRAFERRARDVGLPVINSLAGCDLYHSHRWCLRLWRAGGIECPNCQPILGWKEIRLGYPVILRTDNLHVGLNMHLAQSPKEAQAIFQRNQRPPLDLAIQFIDTNGDGDYYRKWRSHVIGNTVIPRQVQLSRTWKVNLDAAECCAESLEENRTFIFQGEPEAGLVALAAKVLRSDIIGLDYAKKSDGSYIFWEGNRFFDLSVGGHMWSQFRSTTGLSDKECVETVRLIADGIAKLIVERAQGFDPGASALQHQALT